jgi:endonuclease/exonuclease/phosphatase (EEP) superfamily protein YafD
MDSLKIHFFLLAIMVPLLVSAAPKQAGRHELFEQLTTHFGTAIQSGPLPGPGLKIYVWNIHKGKDAKLPQDFQWSSAGIDLALFQEAVSSPAFTESIIAANPSLGWTMAKSFSVANESYTGVATGSLYQPAYEDVIISQPIEPVSRTHKTVLLSEYFVNWQADTLLVANIHAINFVPTQIFKVQIDQLVERVKDHKGALIIGGDFNTWNAGRMEYLKDVFSKLGLKLVKAPENRYLNLDHVFIRGLSVQSVNKMDEIRSSDHTPMRVDLQFN